VMLQRTPWDAALAVHTTRGLVSGVGAKRGLRTAAMREWLVGKPLLLSALFTPHWRRVVSVASGILGEHTQEQVFGQWDEALYVADDFFEPSTLHAVDDGGKLECVQVLALIDRDPVSAAVALHAVCFGGDESHNAHTASAIDIAADRRCASVQRLFGQLAMQPLRLVTPPETSAATLWVPPQLSCRQRFACEFVQLLTMGGALCKLILNSSVQPPQPSSMPAERLRATMLEQVTGATPWLLLAAGGELSLALSDELHHGPLLAHRGVVFLQLVDRLLSQQVQRLAASGMELAILLLCCNAVLSGCILGVGQLPRQCLTSCLERLIVGVGPSVLSALPRAQAEVLSAGARKGHISSALSTGVFRSFSQEKKKAPRSPSF
jgi:hypothetical protein